MTAGHFGLAAGVKAGAQRLPLWALMVATYLLDIVFIMLLAAGGIENFAPIDPAHPSYGAVIIHAYYTHSLVGAGLIALIAGLIAAWAWGQRAGVVIGAVVFSHWLLDLIVHRPDLPILPNNLGNLPLLGLGLWQAPLVSAMLELLLAVVGAYLYYRSALQAATSIHTDGDRRSRALVASVITGLLLLFLLAADLFNLPLMIAVGLMLLLIVLCGWLDARLNWSLSAS